MDARLAESTRANTRPLSFHVVLVAGFLGLLVTAFFLGRYTASIPSVVSVVETESHQTQLTQALDRVAQGRYDEALAMLTVEADHHPDAQFTLGEMYQRGRGVSQDYMQAYKWYLRAAEQDHARAQYALASMYAYGYGVPRDTARASLWSTRAVDNGYGQEQVANAEE